MRWRLVAVAGLLGAAAVAQPTIASPSAPVPHGVVAVIDTGINPYNVVFRDRSAAAYRYPGSYLPGFPKNVPALRLTLDAPSYKAALAKDCTRVWAHVKTGQLYWIPGTKIVGAITFRPTMTAACAGLATSSILDTYWHGTMTASRAVASGYGACPDCRIVVVQAIDGFGINNMEEASQAAIKGLQFAAANSGWIDADTNSWGATTPYDPTGRTGLFSASPALIRAVEKASTSHLSFYASGNGAANANLPPPRTTLGFGQVTPSAIVVGGIDSGHMLSWPNVPVHLAADACDDFGASNTSTTLSSPTIGGGTSAATPYTGGGAVRELMTARRLLGDSGTGVHGGVVARGRPGLVRAGPLADGILTVAEWRRVLLATATTRPAAEPTDGPTCPNALAKWSDVPAGFPEWTLIGYGSVDTPARSAAAAVYAGTAMLPDRTATDAFFTVRDAAVTAQYTAYTAVP
ncbi:MAG: hypothetical protein QOK42_1054 [Frankiaceae bacterium]|nr:hypothetical protein [Frankiaceae bacterium]